LKHHFPVLLILFFGFLLGIHEGKIALWHDDDPQPVKVFPFYAKFLPSADRRALEEGIRFESEEDLKRLLADYMS
jgi:hypothetical protein